jgi:hypothetical protein
MTADILSLVSGALVGLVLGLIGGGGSILAVPLLLYVVGVRDPHVAIGTAAAAVSVSALLNLVSHARAKNVKWPCALVFALTGVAGAVGGSTLGKATDGGVLLALFGAAMVGIGALMLLPRAGGDDPDVRLDKASARRLLPRLAGAGAAAGAASGFFGIGGGFLVVPGLVAATSMPLLSAVGSSLVSVAAFGAATAANYALSGWVDWRIAAIFAVGGGLGGLLGAALARRLGRGPWLKLVFATVVIVVGLYVAARAAMAWL